MSVKLTEDNIERLRCPPGRRDRLVFDTQQRGLAVRVTAGGSTSYLVQYTLDGRKRRCAAWFRIGHFGSHGRTKTVGL